ncbi:MAG: hydroxyethylthiazole kinase [Synergistaceae bacterium]|nr:hydroxyethylthiazole kinase [Synergistaceae bacterium]
MLGSCLNNVRTKSPLVHNITNYVTVNDVANAILAAGASPIMADEPDDAYEITAICNALNINIGTLNSRTIEAMFRAGHRASELGHALLLDPVGAGASTLRTDTAVKLMKEIKFDVIRGNASEIKTLVSGSGTTRGVDADKADAVSDSNLKFMAGFVRDFARSTGSVIALTGAVDLVADAEKCYAIRNGKPEMGRITGTGCMLSGITAAFIAAYPDNKLAACASAVCMMGLAGEIGYSHLQEGEGNSTYRNRIIDAIFNMTPETLERGAKYEIIG